jgi:hypothetical protein
MQPTAKGAHAKGAHAKGARKSQDAPAQEEDGRLQVFCLEERRADLQQKLFGQRRQTHFLHGRKLCGGCAWSVG